MIIGKCIVLVLGILLITVSFYGIIKEILNYRKEIKRIDNEYDIKIICK